MASKRAIGGGWPHKNYKEVLDDMLKTQRERQKEIDKKIREMSIKSAKRDIKFSQFNIVFYSLFGIFYIIFMDTLFLKLWGLAFLVGAVIYLKIRKSARKKLFLLTFLEKGE